ncbi:MAG: hypothetical protein IT561_10930 [Alphaproteobacteria bacterium]|nr:hypothetical protein [Alphaproteobacteria bacterium]
MRSVAAAILALALVLPVPAVAQAPREDGGFMATTARIAGGAWSGLVDGASWAWSAAGAPFLPAAPGPFMPDQWSEPETEFLALMEAAGYRLASIETGGMLLTRVIYRFEQERRLSDGDRDRARRAIEAHRARSWGIAASAHRWVVESVIDAGLSTEFRVATVEVTTRPLPNLTFHVVALDRPLDDSERRLVEEMQPRLTGAAE